MDHEAAEQAASLAMQLALYAGWSGLT